MIPNDEVTADVFVCTGRWIKGPVFLTKSESEWEDCALESTELTVRDFLRCVTHYVMVSCGFIM